MKIKQYNVLFMLGMLLVRTVSLSAMDLFQFDPEPPTPGEIHLAREVAATYIRYLDSKQARGQQEDRRLQKEFLATQQEPNKAYTRFSKEKQLVFGLRVLAEDASCIERRARCPLSSAHSAPVPMRTASVSVPRATANTTPHTPKFIVRYLSCEPACPRPAKKEALESRTFCPESPLAQHARGVLSLAGLTETKNDAPMPVVHRTVLDELPLGEPDSGLEDVADLRSCPATPAIPAPINPWRAVCQQDSDDALYE